MDQRIGKDAAPRDPDQDASLVATHLSDVSELLAAGIMSETAKRVRVDSKDSDVMERLCQVSIT